MTTQRKQKFDRLQTLSLLWQTHCALSGTLTSPSAAVS